MLRWSLIVVFVVLSCGSISCTSASKSIHWYTHEATALKIASERNVPVIADFCSDWCTWCHVLEERVFQDPRIVEKMKGFVPLVFNMSDQSPKDKATMKKYGVTHFPTLVILDPRGRIARTLIGDKTPVPTADQFLAVLDSLKSTHSE